MNTKSLIVPLISIVFFTCGYIGVRNQLNKSDIPPEIVNEVKTEEIQPPDQVIQPQPKEIENSNNTNTVTPPSNLTEEKEAPQTLQNNIYILIVYKSIETDSGIIGMPAGTILIKQNNQYVTNEGITVEVKESEVTNNVEIAKKYVNSDRLTQSQLKKSPPATPVPIVNNSNTTNTEVRLAHPQVSNMNDTFNKIKDGWYWKKNEKGEWVKDRPTKKTKD